jgi:thiol-disulfide isomerase/thioredoxin
MQQSENETTSTIVPKQSFKLRLRFAVCLMLGFAAWVIIDLTLSEKVKAFTAESIGYEAHYFRVLGRSTYSSEEMNKVRKRIVERWNYEEDFFETDAESLAYQTKNNKALAIIHWSGRLFLIALSAIGLFIYFSRRKKYATMHIIDWICLFVSLFFMRDVVLDTIGICFGIWAQEMAIWTHFGIPDKQAFIVFSLIGWLVFLYVLYKLPKGIFFIFIICGVIGSTTGTYLWLKTMRKINPPKFELSILKEGNSAADFNGAIHGSKDSFYFAKYKDSTLVLDFFFSTCGPCLYSIPHINELHAKYRPRGIVFLGINPIEKDWNRLVRFTKQVQIDYPIIKVGEKMRRDYGVSGFPTIMIIDKGKVVLIARGSPTKMKIELTQKLEEILKGKLNH